MMRPIKMIVVFALCLLVFNASAQKLPNKQEANIHKDQALTSMIGTTDDTDFWGEYTLAKSESLNKLSL